MMFPGTVFRVAVASAAPGLQPVQERPFDSRWTLGAALAARDSRSL